jgi:hypothetical protein
MTAARPLPVREHDLGRISWVGYSGPHAAKLKLIMRIGPVVDAMKPDFQGVSTHWNQGFMAFRKARRTRIVMLMIPVRLESGLRTCGACLDH